MARPGYFLAQLLLIAPAGRSGSSVRLVLRSSLVAAILVTSLAAAAHAADSSLEPATELLAECPKAADPNYNEAWPNVSFVRENAEPLLFAVTIKVDGRKVVTLSQGEYTSVHLAPGDHVLGLDWPFFSGHSDTSATFKIEAGKTYDFFVVGSLQQAEKYNQMDAGSGFDPVAPEEAQARIQKCCKFTPPR